MRIVVWNCNGGLGRKLDALGALRPDVAVVAEAPAPERVARGLRSRGLDYRWVGRLPTKGLGVIDFGEHRLELACPIEERIEFALPARVEAPAGAFNLLAVWAMNRRAKVVYPVEPKRYQVQQAVLRYAEFLHEQPSVVAGDFNNHVCWDKPGKPSNMRAAAELLSSHGLVSAYHRSAGIDFGEEPEPTHYWQTRKEDGRTYHIDYCFVPAESSISVSVGSYTDWIATGLSDHVPLVVDVAL